MFTGVAIQVTSAADGNSGHVRFRRKRGLLRCTYKGREIASLISGAWLAEYLTGVSSDQRASQRWGDLEVIRGRGTAQIAVFLEVDPHPLSEREVTDLIYLARRPRLGRRVDRMREVRRAARR